MLRTTCRGWNKTRAVALSNSSEIGEKLFAVIPGNLGTTSKAYSTAASGSSSYYYSPAYAHSPRIGEYHNETYKGIKKNLFDRP